MGGPEWSSQFVSKGSTGVEQRIVHWLNDDTTVELDVPEVIGPQLAPRLQRRRDVEWLGVIRRSNGDCGGLGRLRATRMFVEVFGRSISILRPSIAEALSAALTDEIKAVLPELAGCSTSRVRTTEDLGLRGGHPRESPVILRRDCCLRLSPTAATGRSDPQNTLWFFAIQPERPLPTHDSRRRQSR